MENVPGLRSMKNENGDNCIDILFKCLKNSGYKVDFRMLNACNYSVPQSRLRVIIIGVRKDLNKLPRFPLPVNFGDDEGK